MTKADRVSTVPRADGGAIEIRLRGATGRRTLILTSLVSGESLWRHLVDDLVRDHLVVTWDVPGVGGSSPPRGHGAYLASELAAGLSAVQRHIGARRAVHIGFGLGALVPLELARQRQDEVEALVLVQGGLAPADGKLSWLAAKSRALLTLGSPLTLLLARGARDGEERRRLLRMARTWGLAGRNLGPDDFALFLRDLASLPPMVRFRLVSGLWHHRSTEALTTIKVPTLVIGLEKDPLFPEALAQQVHEQLHDSELAILPGSGHLAPLELGPVVSARIRRFLSSHQ